MGAARPIAIDLGRGPDPVTAFRALAAEPGLAFLWGEWGVGGSRQALLLSRPITTSTDPAVLDGPAAVAPDGHQGFIGGGWVGWLGFDEPAYLARYDHLLRWDEATERWTFEALESESRRAELAARRDGLAAILESAAGRPAAELAEPAEAAVGEFTGPDRATHLAAVESAIGLIRAGEIYQVNVCTRLLAAFAGSPAALFARAVTVLRPRFGAYVDSGAKAVLCLSPELFVRRAGREVDSAPIKGTWKRDPDDPDDDGADQLRRSAKDVAENVMIVDLVRNDLGRVCRPGTVRADRLLQVEPHPGVWHLVSTVHGELRPGIGDAALVAATFPPGSVTGTPKVRALAAIAELEDQPRGVYTGAVALASPASGLTLAVAIRTFEVAGGRIELGVGGGITADSVPELEWRECAQKAVPLLAAIEAGAPASMRDVTDEPASGQRAGGLLETMLAVDGVVPRLPDHLARLERSSRELYSRDLPGGLGARVAAAGHDGPSGRAVVRLVLAADGQVQITVSSAGRRPIGTRLRITRRDGIWRHKWADRSWIGAGESATDQPLYVDADGHLQETSRGNLFLLDDGGVLVTPPLGDGVLPGITRRAVLDLAHDRGRRVALRPIMVGELPTASAVFWTSSISGLVPVTAVDDRPLDATPAGLAHVREVAAALGFGP